MDAGLVLRSLIGFLILHGLALALSEDWRRVSWRPVLAGMLLTLGLGTLLLKLPLFKDFFFGLNDAITL